MCIFKAESQANPLAEIPNMQILYIIIPELLNSIRLKAKNRLIPQDDTPCYHCYRLVQTFITFLTFPI